MAAVPEIVLRSITECHKDTSLAMGFEEMCDFDQPGKANPGAEKVAEGVENLQGEGIVGRENREGRIVE